MLDEMSEATKMYQYHVWATMRVFDHLQKLPVDLLHQSLQSVFPTIGDALAHMYVVDNVWLSAMYGKTEEIYRFVSTWQDEVRNANLDTVRKHFSEAANRYDTFFANQKRDLQAVSEYPHPTHGTLKATFSEIIHHVVNHGTYHRGNITAMLRQMGYAGPSTDYVYYLYTAQ